jgi:16S rRNA processing protein RimM
MTAKEIPPDQAPAGPRDADDWVVVGRIARAHGLKGEVRVFPAVGCDDVCSRIKRFHVETPDGMLDLIPRRVRPANRYLIIAFEGYHGREQAERLRDTTLYVAPQDLPELEEGNVYQFTQLGALVCDEEGRELGTVEEILDSAAHPVFRIVGSEGEFLFPVAEPWIISHEVRDGVPVLVVRLPEGLIESQRPGSQQDQ